MHLHRLELTAYGPFAGTEHVDFDALAQAGLFLLTGHTGAGKTSLLDAVCFALFGSVPGAREQTGRLRSDHAESGVAPRVQLELTVGGRRLRVVRSPTWWAPRKRGRGEPIKQQPTATLAERIDGAWRPLSSRIPEVTQQLQSLLGMDVRQFTQVAMLPQGQFADFLRAGADERRNVLERLFGTARFRSIEQWLVDHRRTCNTRAENALALLRRSVHQVAGAAAVEVPEECPDAWPDWMAATLAVLDASSTEAATREELTRKAHEATRAALEDAKILHGLRVRGLQARSDLQRLRSAQARAAVDARRLEAAERAAPARGHLERLDTATTALVLRQTAADEACRRAAAIALPVPDPASPCGDKVTAAEELVLRAGLQVEAATALQDTVREHGAAQRWLDSLRVELAGARVSVQEIAVRLADAPGHRRDLERRLSRAQRSAAQEQRWRADLARSCRARDAAVALPPARQEQQRVVELCNAANAELNRRTALVNDVVRARLEGAAAWLAGRLADGADCPVCGSVDHPRPHPSIQDHPTEADEQEARHQVEVSRTATSTTAAMVTDAGEAVARLEATSDGRSPEDARLAVERAAAELEAAGAAADQATELHDELSALEAALTHDRDQQQTAAAKVTELTERLRGLEQQHRDRGARLIAALGPELDLPAHLARVLQVDSASRDVLRALRDLMAAGSEHASAQAGAHRAADVAGFADLSAVRAAALPAVELSRLREHLQDHRDELLRVEDVLTDPEVVAALARPEPPVEELLGRLTDQAAASSAAARTASVLRARRQEVSRLATATQAARLAWLPQQRTAALADSMACLVEGKAADNHLRVSLSAFVLGSRLRQVVDAANERFTPMSSGRYSFEYTMDKSAGDRRSASGGLGLLVRDQWTGQTRDPRTLSGGETFWASLSLALGLSDVVTHETGGVELHTLFVDEGFGSLDADSLDDVMDVLDSLRSGGRTVGVVSHVETMRERISVQVRVGKDRIGSTVHQT
ncbi:MAG: AAA family ATPase [Nocardioidaceae bacterium]